MTSNSVVLASNLHDPDALLVEHIEDVGDILRKMYVNCYAIVTETTSIRTKNALTDTNWTIVPQKDGEGIEKISDARRLCLKIGSESHLHTHIIGFDRALYWVKHYPRELESVIEEIPNHDFLVIGRTLEAMRTHPDAQSETERIANRVCSIIINKEMDFTVASRGVSPRIAKLILKHSEAEFCDTDGEWPVIVNFLSEAEIAYRAVDGLGFETSMRKHDMLLGEKTMSWKEYVDSNPTHWLHRINMAQRIVKTAISTYKKLQGSNKR